MSLIEFLIRLLMAVFSLFFFGIEGSPPQRPGEPPTLPGSDSAPVQSFLNVRNVEVIVLESFPMQVQLHITGEWPTGCDYPASVDQQIEANTAVVKIYQEIPSDIMCPMILRPYDDTITLDGNFEAGNYVFQVNDYVVTQTL
jgi:inhibitor of cysteine peptidase